MKGAISAVGFLLIMAGVFGISFTWHSDHRTAESLSAYCRIDFVASRTETGQLEGAVFTMWDYRYGGEKLLPKAILYTDGLPWEMAAAIKQTRGEESEYPETFKNENKLFVEMPKASLPAIRKAESIRFRFYYDNGDTVDLPLNPQDTEYWRRQVQE